MSAPKTVTKVLKNGVQYTSNVDRASYTIKELSRGALRDVAKFVKKQFNINYYQTFKKHTGDAGRSLKAVVYSTEKTIYPRVEIGIPKAHRANKVDGFYSMFQEIGSSKQPRLGLLSHAVQDNVAQIIEIESKYLSALENEAEALKLINEQETEIDEV